MEPTRVQDIMLSLSEYAVVSEDATLAEALRVLDEAQEKVPPGRQPHRAVLVRNKAGEIVGKLGHLAFLAALLPRGRTLFVDSRVERAGIGDDLIESSVRALSLLDDDLVDLCERASHVRVGDACMPIDVHLDCKASLAEAIRKLTERRTLSLLVTCRGETVGILRLSDLFEELAGQVRRSGLAPSPRGLGDA